MTPENPGDTTADELDTTLGSKNIDNLNRRKGGVRDGRLNPLKQDLGEGRGIAKQPLSAQRLQLRNLNKSHLAAVNYRRARHKWMLPNTD